MGKNWGAVVAMHDIGDRRPTEQQLRLFESVVVHTNDAVLITEATPHDEPGPRIIYANEAFTRMTGYSEAEVRGLNPRFLQGPKTDRAALDQIRAGLAAGQPVRVEMINYRKAESAFADGGPEAGREFWVELSIVPVPNDQGCHSHWISVQRNISDRKRGEENLQKSEERFRNLTENVKDYAIFAMDTKARIFSWNVGAERLLGYSESEVLGQHYSMLFRPEDVALGAAQKEVDIALRDGRGEEARWHQRKDGSQFWASEILNPLRDKQGRLHGFSKIMRDTSDRKQAEEALKKTQERLELAQQVGKIGTFEWDFQTSTFIATPGLESVYGLTPSSFGGLPENWLQRVHPDDQVRVETEATSAVTTGRFDTEFRILWPDGSLRWIAAKAQVFKDDAGNPLRMVGVNVDISDRKQAEEQIKASLAEKEVLLKEIHHRVKNNLQVVRSLLNLQSRYIQDQASLKIFKDSQDRIGSMALIHEKLYQSEDLARIGFDEYVRDLATNLFRSYNVRSGSVILKLSLDKVSLRIDLAVPCGFIVNELVTNSLRHAFPAGETGEICIGIHLSDLNEFVLSISDNGIGFPKDLDFQNTQSLGLKLVNTLAKQLKGTVKLNRQGGTEFTLTFPA